MKAQISLPSFPFPVRRVGSSVKMAAACLTIGIATTAHAQTQIQLNGTQNQAIAKALGQQLQLAFNNMFKHRVRVTPALTQVDPHTHTATLEFINESDDTVNATLTAGTTPPNLLARKHPASAQASAGALLANDSSTTASTTDSVASDMSLATWLQDLPDHVQLAPHEKKSITLHVNVPDHLKPGEYAAWVVATTKVGGAKSAQQGKSINLIFNGKDGKPLQLQGGGKLVYHAGQ